MEDFKLYEIKEAMIDTLDIFLESEGKDLDQESYTDIMLFLRDELKKKSHSLIQYIQNLKAKSEFAKKESDRLAMVSKLNTNKVERLKSYLLSTMQILDEKKIETDLGSYGVRKNPPSIEVYDMSVLPSEFIKIMEDKKPDKEKIKEYIKTHGELQGVRIVQNYSLQIR